MKFWKSLSAVWRIQCKRPLVVCRIYSQFHICWKYRKWRLWFLTILLSWVVTPYGFLSRYQRYSPEDVGGMFLRNAWFYLRAMSSFSRLWNPSRFPYFRKLYFEVGHNFLPNYFVYLWWSSVIFFMEVFWLLWLAERCEYNCWRVVFRNGHPSTPDRN